MMKIKINPKAINLKVLLPIVAGTAAGLGISNVIANVFLGKRVNKLDDIVEEMCEETSYLDNAIDELNEVSDVVLKTQDETMRNMSGVMAVVRRLAKQTRMSDSVYSTEFQKGVDEYEAYKSRYERRTGDEEAVSD